MKLRRLLPLLLGLAVLAAFLWTLVFLYDKSKKHPIVYRTATPAISDVVQKTVAAGAIVPRQEVAIKARVSGVLDKLYVAAGQVVERGNKVARIRIIPNMVNLNSAEARLRTAEISLSSTKDQYDRLDKLFAEHLVSQTDLHRAELDFQLAEQERAAAQSNLSLVRDGAVRGSGKVSNIVSSTVSGMVIEVPVKEGASVIEANNFNEGTTIASVADMQDMIFQGHVDETEVGKLRVDMPVSISVGAMDKSRFEGTLEYISPKGVDNEGTIEFEVRAALKLQPGTFLRANYSANADIILERRNHVLTVDESLLGFDHSKAYVEVETGPQHFERRFLQLGLSDGMKVEILRGLSLSDRIKIPATAGQDGTNGPH